MRLRFLIALLVPVMALGQSVDERPVSWKRLLPNLLDDQKRIWTLPVRLAQGQDWVPTVAVVGVTGGLLAADGSAAGYFRGTNAFHGFNSAFNSKATAVGTVVAPVSLYVAGLVRHDSKMQRTALLAGEAVADAEIVTTLFKGVTRRVRPADVPAGQGFSDTWFENKRVNGSFPSGHTIAAFSVATIVARRYGREHRWVPYAAYGMAAVVAGSRLTLSAHYLSDVFMGGALGYTISRYTVLR